MAQFCRSVPARLSPAVQGLLFVGSAAGVAALVRYGLGRQALSVAGVVVSAGGVLWLAGRWWAHRRLLRRLRSGRPDELLQAWHDALLSMPNAETTVPLLQATALAASGLTERARAALARAERGEAWQAAYEHRLMIETLLDAFEGERLEAVSKGERLCSLPLPEVTGDLRERIILLRESVAALARAFAHAAEPRDASLLWEAARRNALIHWPLRYAAAVVCVDRGLLAEADRLLAGAPSWPEDSAFRAFHAELCSRLSLPSR
jgi:hypothetical protein